MPGKTASAVTFVTGGGRGIGAAVATRLGGHGAPIAVGYRERAAEAEAVSASIRAAGGLALAVGADLSDVDSVDAAFGRIESELGPVGVLVNNAGLHLGGKVHQLLPSDWHRVIDACLTSSFLCARRATPAMIEAGAGRIINVSSVVGLNGFPGDAAYASAKAGLIGLTKAIALELARHGISVNVVAPGFVDTDMTRGLAPEVLDKVHRSIPSRRLSSPEEIAEVIEFLALGPSYLTGSLITIDGGWSIA